MAGYIKVDEKKLARQVAGHRQYELVLPLKPMKRGRLRAIRSDLVHQIAYNEHERPQCLNAIEALVIVAALQELLDAQGKP